MTKQLKQTNGVKGDGFWGTWQGVVHGVLEFNRYQWCIDEDNDYANAKFHLDIWDPGDGLIYTDSLFLEDLQKNLKAAGFKHYNNISYSEQGMQGSKFVDLDCSAKLAKEAKELGYGVNLVG